MYNGVPLMMPSGCPGCWRHGHDHRGRRCPNFSNPPRWYRKMLEQEYDRHQELQKKVESSLAILALTTFTVIFFMAAYYYQP